MTLSIDIPKDLEEALRAEWGGNLEQAAKEALLIESYRAGKISVGFLAQLLRVTRWEVESWLASRGVKWNYDADELDADHRTLTDLLGQ
jgi:predicted HTH domain antitoxin